MANLITGRKSQGKHARRIGNARINLEVALRIA
jgi:hypothetical protein